MIYVHCICSGENDEIVQGDGCGMLIHVHCICSGENDEIVECDGCGVAVHEGCYGMTDAASIASTGK